MQNIINTLHEMSERATALESSESRRDKYERDGLLISIQAITEDMGTGRIKS